MNLPLWIWPWIGALAAVITESWFRANLGAPYWRAWVPMLMALVVNYSVFRIMQTASSLLAGFVVFSAATLLLRTAAAIVVLREAVDVRTWLAIGLLLAAKALIR